MYVLRASVTGKLFYSTLPTNILWYEINIIIILLEKVCFKFSNCVIALRTFLMLKYDWLFPRFTVLFTDIDIYKRKYNLYANWWDSPVDKTISVAVACLKQLPDAFLVADGACFTFSIRSLWHFHFIFCLSIVTNYQHTIPLFRVHLFLRFLLVTFRNWL